MTSSSLENEEEADTTTDDESEDDNNQTDTEISARLAALDLTVRTEGQEECEEMFYRVWDKINEDAEEMSDALRERMGGLN